MTLEKQLGKLLYKARTEAGLTQQQTADSASISVRWYQRIEKGERLPSTYTFVCLILFFRIDVEEFREAVNIIVPIYSV